ncbi:hypothetical protein Cantr_09923 [Candida viswanathii]|uniref:Uncharacterized protein n=1 Tax=Candida viswanathii TaxID=5486 RepID=A0A367YB85_9ASCO|nr:hypothetical protein Cantr_09923 [Candida viswanathii]
MNVNQLRIPKTLHFADEISQLNNNFNSVNSYNKTNNSNNQNNNTPTSPTSPNGNNMSTKPRSINKFINSNSKFFQECNNNNNNNNSSSSQNGNGRHVGANSGGGLKNGNFNRKTSNRNGKVLNGNSNGACIKNGSGTPGSGGSMIYDIIELYMLPESAEQQKQRAHAKKKLLDPGVSKTTTSTTPATASKTTSPTKVKRDAGAKSQTVLMNSLHKGYHQFFADESLGHQNTPKTTPKPNSANLATQTNGRGSSYVKQPSTKVIPDGNDENEERFENTEGTGCSSSCCDVLGNIVDVYDDDDGNEDEIMEDAEEAHNANAKCHGFWWRTTTMVHKLRTLGHRSFSSSSANRMEGYQGHSSTKRRESVDEKLKSIFSDGTIEEKNLHDGFVQHQLQPLPKRRVTIQDKAEIIYPTSDLNYYKRRPLSSSHFQRKVSRKFSFFKKGF